MRLSHLVPNKCISVRARQVPSVVLYGVRLTSVFALHALLWPVNELTVPCVTDLTGGSLQIKILFVLTLGGRELSPLEL